MSRRLALLVIAAVLAIVAWPATCDAIASVAVAARAEAGPTVEIVEDGSRGLARVAARRVPPAPEVRVSHIASAAALYASIVLLVLLGLVSVLFGPRSNALLRRRPSGRPVPLPTGWGALAPSRAPPAS